MLAEIFKAILITSVIGTVLTVLLVLFKPISKKLFGYKWHYYIWLAVLVVMILPVRFAPLRTEKISLVTESTSQSAYTESSAAYGVNEDTQTITIVSKQIQTPKNYILTNIIHQSTNKLAVIWLIGVLLILLINTIGYCKLLYNIHKRSCIISCPEIHKYTKRSIIVRICTDLPSPFIIGIFRPSLILPDIQLSPQQLDNIIMHEVTHLKRNDILCKWFLSIVKALHWFNPAVYYVAKQIHTECEISCDLSVVGNMNSTQTTNYIDTILSLLSADKAHTLPLTTGMTGNKNILKKRFSMIKNKKSTSIIMSVISLIIAVIMLSAAVFASGALLNITNDDCKIEVTFDETILQFKNQPFIENEEVYLPLPECLENIERIYSLKNEIIRDNQKVFLHLIKNDTRKKYNNDGVEIGNEAVTLHSFWGLEINKKELTLNPETSIFEYHSRAVPIIQATKNAPIIKGNTTYIPLEMLNHLFSGITGLKPAFNTIVYDADGKILSMTSVPGLSDERINNTQNIQDGIYVKNTADRDIAAQNTDIDNRSEKTDNIVFSYNTDNINFDLNNTNNFSSIAEAEQYLHSAGKVAADDKNFKPGHNYIINNYSFKDNTGEKISNITGNSNGEISIYLNGNLDTLMRVSFTDSKTKDEVNSAVILTGKERIYKFTGLDPTKQYDIELTDLTEGEWKIEGEYLIF